jgi:hypothetical protein
MRVHSVSLHTMYLCHHACDHATDRSPALSASVARYAVVLTGMRIQDMACDHGGRICCAGAGDTDACRGTASACRGDRRATRAERAVVASRLGVVVGRRAGICAGR